MVTARTPERITTDGQDPPRVLILSKPLGSDGGVVNIVANLLNRLAAKIDYTHFEFSRSRRGTYGPVQLFGDAWRLGRQIRCGRWDCVHINPSLNWPSLLRDSVLMITMAVSGARNVLVFLHGWEQPVAGTLRRNRWLRRVFAQVMNRASRILVLASAFKDELRDLGVAEERIAVVPAMFDGEVFRDTPAVPAGGHPTVLFLSRFVREKGIYELLEAFAELVRRYPRARLILVGDGPEAGRMREWIERHRLGGHVEMPGYLRGRDKAAALLSADLFVFPTYYGEGCPISLLEAMAAGLPIITTPVGGIPDIFDDHDNGILLPEVNPRSIVDAIETLVCDRERRRRISERNRIKAWREFEAGRMSARIARYYRHPERG